MVLILSDSFSPRLQYVADFIFKENFGIGYSITTDKNSFKNSDAIRINYTPEVIAGDVIHIAGSRLLFEKKIYSQKIEIFLIDDLVAFFRNQEGPGNFPFDIFSATFYLLSRYEEYLPHAKDPYGRYDHRQSTAALNGFLRIPLINKWLLYFADFLQEKYHGIQLKKNVFSYQPTYDVDVAFDWKYKGLVRNAGQMLSLLARQDYKKISQGTKVLKGEENDPSDNFEFFAKLHKRLSLKPTYFFLISNKITRYDKNINPDSEGMRDFIQQVAAKNSIGIHPSYYSMLHENLLKSEKFLLEDIVGITVLKSRQHYLRFVLPDTYRQLIDAGIKEEYSMGYGSTNGFRASYAGTFYWYDLEKEQQTNLSIHPFCYMDSNVIFHQKLTSAESVEELKYFYETCKAVNGLFITVMHNHLMGDNDIEWRNAYEQFLYDTIKH
ncbi:MAG: polysaccharide deacetylase family protein [Ginsengibacter sp.]